MDLTNAVENPKGVYKKDGTIVKVEQDALNAFCVSTKEELAQVAQIFWQGVVAIGPEAFAGLDFSKVTEASKERFKTGEMLVNQDIDKNYATPAPSFYIPAEIRTIGEGAFKGCTNMESVQIGYRHFDKNADKMFQSAGAHIEKEAFANIQGLVAVFIASDKTTIDESAFAGNGFKNKFDHTTISLDGKIKDFAGYTSLSEEEIKKRMQSIVHSHDMQIEGIDQNLIKGAIKETDDPTM